MTQTACPLDCYDACGVTCDPSYPDKLTATPTHPLYNGALCAILNKHIHEVPRITKPKVDGKEVSMDEALDAVADAFRSKSILGWSGSGNLGFMQSVTDLLIERVGGTLTSGSLCDSAGQAGIVSGRSYHKQLPIDQVKNAEVVVVWGRNLTVTNKHIMPLLEGKKIIVIDPVRTEIAKKADLFLQIKPRSDFYLAIMLARFAIMEGSEDHEWLEEHAPDWEEFYEFTHEFRINSVLKHIDIDLSTIGDMLYMMQGGKTVFLVGIGLQHYTIGHFALWAIDSLAAVLGLFGKDGSGVNFMGESLNGFDYPLETSCSRVSIVNTPFEEYDTVLVRGGNPAGSMPDTNRVVKSLESVKDLIFFGLYECETSRLARIVIPAKNFLEKEDLRLSYGHYCVQPMHKVLEADQGISEYEFTMAILDRLDLDGLEDERFYIDKMLEQCDEVDGLLVSPDYASVPYKDGFGEDGEDEFVFMDEFDDEFEPTELRNFIKQDHETMQDEYWLLTPKTLNSLNTQFVRKSYIYLPTSMGYENGQFVKVSSEWGGLELEVKVSDDLRDDCVKVYNSTPGVNRLTAPYLSEEGGGACYGDTKVRIERL